MEKCGSQRTGKSIKRKTLVFGLLLLGLGTTWLLYNMGILPYEAWDAIISWQTLLIAIGLINIANGGSRGFGFILILVGGFFLLSEFYVIPLSFTKAFWPSLLILGGIILLFGSRKLFRNRRISNGKDEDMIEEVAVFSGKNRIITSQAFRGGEVVNIFGGSKLDLSMANPSSEKCELEIVWIFGGSSLIVPHDWNVKLEVFSIFGGFEDKRQVKAVDLNKTLILKGVVVFGGGEIKNPGS